MSKKSVMESRMMGNGGGGGGDSIGGYKGDLKGGGKNRIEVYEGVLFGEDQQGMGVGLGGEIRRDSGEDLEGELKVGWYGIWGSKWLNGSDGVMIESG